MKNDWSPQEEKMLAELYPSAAMTIEAIAKQLRRGTQTVRNKARAMKLRRPDMKKGPKHIPRHWQEWEYDKLREIWTDPRLTLNDIAVAMERPYGAVQYRADLIGLELRGVNHTKGSDRIFRWPITPWPEDMPDFQDHPRTVTNPRTGGRYVMGEG